MNIESDVQRACYMAFATSAPAIDAGWPRRGTRLGAEHESAAPRSGGRPKQRSENGRVLTQVTHGPMIVRSSITRIVGDLHGDNHGILPTLILQGALAFSDIIECLPLARK